MCTRLGLGSIIYLHPQNNIYFVQSDLDANKFIVNSLTAIGAHECQGFNKLHGTVVSRQIVIRSQSLIAR